jgi:hypothetical protein
MALGSARGLPSAFPRQYEPRGLNAAFEAIGMIFYDISAASAAAPFPCPGVQLSGTAIPPPESSRRA